MRPFLCGLSLLAATVPAAASPTCHVDTFRFVFGLDTSASMVEKGGAPCTIHINDLAGVRSAAVVQAPANGTAWTTDDHHVTYKSKPGFHGPDRFVVAIDGASSSNNRGRVMDGVAKIAVDVNVVP